MPRVISIDPKAIARRNPRVDLIKLKSAQQVQRELEQRRHIRPGYRLASPFDRKLRPVIKRVVQTDS